MIFVGAILMLIGMMVFAPITIANAASVPESQSVVNTVSETNNIHSNVTADYARADEGSYDEDCEYKETEENTIPPEYSYSVSMRAMNPEEEEKWETMYVCVSNTKMYENPTNENVCKELIFAEKVEVDFADEVQGWAKVRVDGKEGYVADYTLMTETDLLDSFQYLLAQVIYAEAGGVSKEEMGLVGEVYLNRLTTTYWEFAKVNTLIDVLAQSGQYPDTYRKIRNGLVPSEDAMEVAKTMLIGEYENVLPDDCYWQTGFYPTWSVKVIYISDCGHHYSVLAS